MSLLALHRRPALLTGHVLLVVLSVSLCFVPLFNLLAYEFSLVLAAALALLSPVMSVALLRAEPKQNERLPAQSLAWLCAQQAVFLLAPLLLISANALRVKNCNYFEGLALFALLPGVTLVFAAALTLVWYRLFRGRRWAVLLAYYLTFLLSVLGALAQLALQPPIVLVNAFVGYFAGSIYDEALGVPLPLLFYRLALLFLVLGLTMCWDVAASARAGLKASGLQAMLGALLVSAAFAAHAQHRELGYSMDREALEQALSYRVQTEHFEIFLSPSGDWPKRADELAEDHEFRYHQLSRYLGVEPRQRIRSYVYPDRELKGVLMGSQRTLVAKLWLGEIHISYGAYGDSLTKHELAHVFSAEFADGPLHLPSRWGVLVNIGLVEGIAVAAQWPVDELTPHGWAAALHRLELAPSIASILAPTGFWAQHSRTAYTLMGSFVRWLIDEYGIERFARAYRSAELESVYGESLTTLVERWRTFLDEQVLSEEALELARYYYDRPSIFGKVCARDLAERSRQAGVLSSSGRHAEAIEAMREVVAADDSPFRRQDLLGVLVRAREYEAARELLLELLVDERLGGVERDTLRHELGDLYWRMGQPSRAREVYSELNQKLALPGALRRTIQVKILAVSDDDLRDVVYGYFFEERDAARRLALLFEAQAKQPANALLHYLSAVQLAGLREHEAAARHAKLAMKTGLEQANLLENAAFVAAEADYQQGRYDDAALVFADLSRTAAFEGSRVRAADWLERIEWRRQQ